MVYHDKETNSSLFNFCVPSQDIRVVFFDHAEILVLASVLYWLIIILSNAFTSSNSSYLEDNSVLYAMPSFVLILPFASMTVTCPSTEGHQMHARVKRIHRTTLK